MKMVEWFHRRRARQLFAKKVKDFWYCGEFYFYQHKLYLAGQPWGASEIVLSCETFLVDPYDETPKVGMIIHCQRLQGWVAYYKVTKVDWYSSAGSDFASWDDGRIIDLQFIQCYREQPHAACE